MVAQSAFVLALFAMLLAPFYKPVVHRLTVLGLTRSEKNFVNMHGEGLRRIPDTVACEDVHLHADSGLIFAACQEDITTRHKWFPPLTHFDTQGAEDRGSLVVVDPKTFTSKHLTFTGFNSPFITHGFDVITGEDPSTVLIFAINHLANPTVSSINLPNGTYFYPTDHLVSRSQIELFRHVIGTSTAEHVRSIRHPLILTPNDIVATSPTSFFVTNDHHYRSGPLRVMETILTEYLAGWSTTIHVQLTDVVSPEPEGGILATTAMKGLHNNNGLGHADPSRPDEILIGDAAGGVLIRARRIPAYSLAAGSLEAIAGAKERGVAAAAGAEQLQAFDRIYMDSCIDNPSWYRDPYATAHSNASGYVLAGLARGYTLDDEFAHADKPIPVVVWHVRTSGEPDASMGAILTGHARGHDKWEKRAIFQDDGRALRSASAAVLVGIDPQENGGRKQAWLFVTGFASEAMVVTKVDL